MSLFFRIDCYVSWLVNVCTACHGLPIMFMAHIFCKNNRKMIIKS